MRAAVVLLVALVAFGALAGAADAAPMWAGCRPHWDGETYQPVDVAGQTVWVPKTETLCY